jgi:UDP-2,4-diacetamido-2,4,6-trideoxy-beta-L-altropyranose hydrolase
MPFSQSTLDSLAIVIRADASVQIGSGHVMRCLTLADELRLRGATILFVCRDFEGNLYHHITAKGYECALLPRPTKPYTIPNDEYAAWMGVPRGEDAEATATVCADFAVRCGRGGMIDWVIADHYAIDTRWEQHIRLFSQRVMVIDDIANRPHDCDILLDQNLYDNPAQRYDGLVPKHCRLLLGPNYALLRPEFREARALMGERLVRGGDIRRIMIFFGGSDPSNETAKAVEALQMLGRDDIDVDVIVGISNPHREEIEHMCAKIPHFHFHYQISNMADFMVRADLALGAGGSTTWERCCLGLPTIAVIIAENQAEMTEAGAQHGIQWSAGHSHTVTASKLGNLLHSVLSNADWYHIASETAHILVDGFGVERVADVLYFGMVFTNSTSNISHYNHSLLTPKLEESV